MADLETLQAGQPVRPARIAKAERREKIRSTLPRGYLQLAGALYIAQRGQCFHCGGPMPILGSRRQPGSTTKEHVLTGVARTGDASTDCAFVLAHQLCNGDRGHRWLTAIEWQRAWETWSRAASIWSALHGRHSAFDAWIDLAARKQKEST